MINDDEYPISNQKNFQTQTVHQHNKLGDDMISFNKIRSPEHKTYIEHLTYIKQARSPNTILNKTEKIKIHCTVLFTKCLEKLFCSTRKLNPLTERLSYLIYPDSKLYKTWEILITLLLAYTAIILPYTICFMNSELFNNLEIFTDIFFLFNILLSFFTAYYAKDGLIVDNLHMIIWNYIQGWFILDLISSFPLISENYSFLRLLKLIRVFKYHKMLNKYVLKIKSWGKVITIFLFLFLVIHISSCLWYYLNKNNTPDNWITFHNFQDEGHFVIYINAFYYSSTALFTVGFGDITPQNNYEKIYCILWMFFGAGFYSYTIGNILTILHNFDREKSLLTKKITQIDEFTSKIKLSTTMSNRIKKFYQNKFQARYMHDESGLMESLAGNEKLKYKVVKSIYSSVLSMFDIFEGEIQNNIPFVNDFMLKMKPLFIEDGKYRIYNFGELSAEIFFLLSGKIVLIDEDENQKIFYGAGVYFGEVEVFFDETRFFSVESIKPCEILFIAKEDFLHFIKKIPSLYEKEIGKAYKRRSFFLNKMGKKRKRSSVPFIEEYVDSESSDEICISPKRKFKKEEDVSYLMDNDAMDRIHVDNLVINLEQVVKVKERMKEYGKEYHKQYNSVLNFLDKLQPHSDES